MKLNRCSSPTRYVSQAVVAALAVWGAATALAADTSGTTTGQLDRKDASFIKEAAQGNEAEVQLGKLAMEKATSQDVKQLGQHLQTDHAKGNKQLMQLAQTKGVTLPTEPPRNEERLADRLENKSGSDFDKAFAEHAIKDHEKDIQKYDKALQNTKDPDVKAYIEKCLPVLRQHLQMARNAGSAVGVEQKVLLSADKFLSSHAIEGVGTAPGAETGRSTTDKSTDLDHTK
jgi:putative membrane protein